jgi:dihydrofolate synthase/folylpolyglutamate synthase
LSLEYPLELSEPIHDSAAAGRYLETLINFEQRPELMRERLSLAPIRALLDRLGNPEHGLSVIHVAGSKGKGSTCLFAEAALASAGRRTGVFTSPHIHRWTERFRLMGAEVEGDVLARAVNQLRPQLEWLRENDPANAPTFFDATTAAALLIFAEAGLDYAILEVGLGGRLDSTNAVSPRVTCITSIELEHTDKLGNTLAEIAAEKAGIIKPGTPCVMGRLPEEAEAVVQARAHELAAPLIRLGHDFESLAPSALSVLGRHQLDNAAIALQAVAQLADPNVSEQAARLGLKVVTLPGRIEVVSEDPWIVVDGAHTDESARMLAEVVRNRAADSGTLLLSVSRDKNLDGIFEALLPLFNCVVTTEADTHRSFSANELAAKIIALRPEVDVHAIADPLQAAAFAREKTRPGDALVAAGSIYLAAAARERWSTDSRCKGQNSR